MTRRGKLIVISGPSGAGKGTLRKMLFDAMPELAFSVSCTTRRPRPGEVDGVDYRFISDEEFAEQVERDAFLEWAGVHGRMYGTLREEVEKCLASGRSMVLEIDEQGCRQVKERMPEATCIFIMPPSIGELRRRLESRAADDPRQIEVRLANAEKELERAKAYEHIILNDDVNVASRHLIELVRSYVGR